jgi:Tfp pilus assembly protein PilZ
MQTLVLNCKDASQFMGHYLDTIPGGGVFVVTRKASPGQRVALQVKFRDMDESFFLTGWVLSWRRRHVGQSGDKEKFGVDVAFDWDEGETVTKIFQCIRASLEPVQSRIPAERFDTDLDVCYFGCDRTTLLQGRTTNLSKTGLFLRSTAMVPIGSEIQLKLKNKYESAHHAVKGKVTWIERKGAEPGMGVEFVFSGMFEKRRMASFVKHAAIY